MFLVGYSESFLNTGGTQRNGQKNKELDNDAQNLTLET